MSLTLHLFQDETPGGLAVSLHLCAAMSSHFSTQLIERHLVHVIPDRGVDDPFVERVDGLVEDRLIEDGLVMPVWPAHPTSAG
jgi:hypothetical protein